MHTHIHGTTPSLIMSTSILYTSAPPGSPMIQYLIVAIPVMALLLNLFYFYIVNW
jgi:hypothetical protein